MYTQQTPQASSAIPTTLPTFLARFQTEHHCRDYLAQQQREAGFRCPSCSNTTAWWHAPQASWHCIGCTQQVPLTAGTPMEGSEQPLQQWFLAAWLLASQGSSLSARQLQSTLNIKRYDLAWDMLRRLRGSADDSVKGLLNGSVEVDEAALCAEQVRLRPLPAGPTDIIILGAAEVRGTGIGRVRLAVAPDLSAQSLGGFVRSNIQPRSSTVLTDNLLGYRRLSCSGYEHISVVEPGRGSAVRELPRIHRVFEDLCDWLASRPVRASRADIEASIHEYQERFNRRQQPAASFQSLLGLPVTCRRLSRATDRATGS